MQHFWAITAIFNGFVNAGILTHIVHAPTLAKRYCGVIEGRVIGIGRSTWEALRLRLGEVRLGKISKTCTPPRFCVSLYGPSLEQDWIIADWFVRKGSFVSLQRHAEPCGFDFVTMPIFRGFKERGINVKKQSLSVQMILISSFGLRICNGLYLLAYRWF